ncbi:unnamed protein product [Orchesella dallaii]|uniref:F-box domain-containing protein n=1 Tax=Orchesella dallaii TaxID=48710 RepID=A0ABP1QZT0_9HEXA
MDRIGPSTEEKVEERYVSPPVTPAIAPTSPPPDAAEETCWDSLPPEVREMIMEKAGDGNKQKLLRYRLVNSSWKSTVDMVFERRFLSMWTEWDPIEPERDTINIWDFIPYDEHESEDDYDDDGNPTVGLILARAMKAGVPCLRPTWSLSPQYDRNKNLIPTFDHHLPDVHNSKLGSPIPTNSLRIRFHDNIWPDKARFERLRRSQMFADLVVQYDHCFSYLRALLLTDMEISPSNLATILGKLPNLKALTLEDTVLVVEPADVINQDENDPLPPHSSLTHLRIISTNNSASQLFLKAYHEQLVSLETNSCVPFFSKPYGKLKRLKLITDLKPDEQFPQGEENPFPSLKYLSVIIHGGHIFEWDELIQFIDALPRALTNLHLDIQPRWETEEKKIGQLLMSEVTFLHLKTLGIFLPASPQHAHFLLNLILPKFPSVQKLNLIDGYWRFKGEMGGASDNQDEIDNHELIEIRQCAARHVRMEVTAMVQELEFYAQVCPKLKYLDLI